MKYGNHLDAKKNTNAPQTNIEFQTLIDNNDLGATIVLAPRIAKHTMDNSCVTISSILNTFNAPLQLQHFTTWDQYLKTF